MQTFMTVNANNSNKQVFLFHLRIRTT